MAYFVLYFFAVILGIADDFEGFFDISLILFIGIHVIDTQDLILIFADIRNDLAGQDLFLSLGLLFLLVFIDDNVIENIPLVPFPVKLFLDQLYYSFLLSLDSSLFLSKSIQFGLLFCYLFPKGAEVADARIGILIPDV